MTPMTGRRPELEQFAAAVKVAVGRRPRRVIAECVAARSGESVSQPAVAQWEAAEIEPSRAKVFALEDCLGRPKGTLSRLLGYLPVDAVPALGVLDAIEADPHLSDESRRLLRRLYEEARSSE